MATHVQANVVMRLLMTIFRAVRQVSVSSHEVSMLPLTESLGANGFGEAGGTKRRIKMAPNINVPKMDQYYT